MAGRGMGFGPSGEYTHASQSEGANYFAQEGGLPLVGFDQRHGQGRIPKFDRKTGEAWARAHVDQMNAGA